MPDIKTRVKRTIQEQLFLKDNEVGDSDTLEELGADSLDEVELIMALEEEFEIEIADADAEKFKTVQDVVDYTTGLGLVPE